MTLPGETPRTCFVLYEENVSTKFDNIRVFGWQKGYKVIQLLLLTILLHQMILEERPVHLTL